jgi:hypothetical protein
MRTTILAFAALLGGVCSIGPATAGILPAFVGNWSGSCTYTVIGQPTQLIPLTIVIQDVDAATVTWNMTYSMPSGPVVKNYLIRAGSAPDRFVFDEQNGILIDQILIGNRLMDDYDYNAERRLRTSTEVSGNAMYFENLGFSIAGARSTKAGTARVKSYPFHSLEACSLTR